jgi:ABC-type phosphate transport system substrate-binding protein
MKAVAFFALALLAGCASKPAAPPAVDACPPLPAPSGNGLAAQAAYAHTLVPLYAACAASKAKT